MDGMPSVCAFSSLYCYGPAVPARAAVAPLQAVEVGAEAVGELSARPSSLMFLVGKLLRASTLFWVLPRPVQLRMRRISEPVIAPRIPAPRFPKALPRPYCCSGLA